MLKVTATSKIDVDNCPVRQVLAKVSGKWQVLIVLALRDGALRFGQIKREIGDVTQRVLTENLRNLERDGYLTREVIPGPPVEVHYELTDLGMELMELQKTMVVWADRNHPIVRENREAYDQRQS